VQFIVIFLVMQHEVGQRSGLQLQHLSKDIKGQHDALVLFSTSQMFTI